MRDSERENDSWNSSSWSSKDITADNDREKKGFQIPEFMSEKKREPEPELPRHISKKQRNQTYSRIAYLFSVLFLSLVGYLVYFNVSLRDTIIKNPNNSKADAQTQYVRRGSIFSGDGQTLAVTSTDENGGEYRIYPYGSLFSHVVGYTTNGKTGLEAIYNNDLMTSNTSIMDQVGSEASNTKLDGDNLMLTLDTRLQQAASNALGAYRGAVIVMEPSTGKILAMVSKPDFDPNEMEEQWEVLTADDSRSPLLNRATQGLYPPGSTFKIMTTLEYIREFPNDYMNYTYDCQGSTSQGDMTIKCYDYEVHGFEDLQGSFQHSCNTSFANIGLQLDNGKFRSLCEDFMFNGDLPTVLAYSSSRFELNNNSSTGEVMTTAIGQGNTLVSPFHMALITASVANDGVLMYPYLVDRIENSAGVVVNETKPIQYKKMMTASEASVLQSYMQSVVEGGTASSLWGLDYTVAGKTGSAEYEVDGNTGQEENFSTHSWFVGYSNVEDPDIVVVVIAEDGGTGSSAAVPIARSVFDTYYYSVKAGGEDY